MAASSDNAGNASSEGPSLRTVVCGLSLPSCVFNSSNPFATSLEDLQALDASAAGAVATRTACPGFVHDEATMKWASPDGANTINCLGYSPLPFEYYTGCLPQLSGAKPCWLSISGSAEEVGAMVREAAALAPSLPGGLAVEINLSCPNIAGKPPLAYDFDKDMNVVPHPDAVAPLRGRYLGASAEEWRRGRPRWRTRPRAEVEEEMVVKRKRLEKRKSRAVRECSGNFLFYTL